MYLWPNKRILVFRAKALWLSPSVGLKTIYTTDFTGRQLSWIFEDNNLGLYTQPNWNHYVHLRGRKVIHLKVIVAVLEDVHLSEILTYFAVWFGLVDKYDNMSNKAIFAFFMVSVGIASILYSNNLYRKLSLPHLKVLLVSFCQWNTHGSYGPEGEVNNTNWSHSFEWPTIRWLKYLKLITNKIIVNHQVNKTTAGEAGSTLASILRNLIEN